MMRKSNLYLFFLATGLAFLILMASHASYTTGNEAQLLKSGVQTVRGLQLTDLCLFTEANYTRHLSQADMNAPFQDYPMSFEHFPSGSFVPPPFLLKKTAHEALD